MHCPFIECSIVKTKREIIIFMNKINTQPFIGLLNPLFWGDKVIQYKSFPGCLGVTIDKLSWVNHVKSVTQSFSSKVKMLRPVSFLPRAILQTRQILQDSSSKNITRSNYLEPCSEHLLKDLELVHLSAAGLFLFIIFQEISMEDMILFL